jgi:hypothetical protein
VWLWLVLALISANLPFLSERVLSIFVWREQGVVAPKPFWLCLFELLVFYVVVGSLGVAIEAKLGNRFAQGWQFYVITCCIFLILAYPGFVRRYLWQSASCRR